MASNTPSISGFFIQKTAELTNAIKGTVEQDQPLTASQKQRIEEVLSRALYISVEEFRKYARNLEMIRMEDARDVIEGFHKHLRITCRAMEHCIVPLLDAFPDVKVCSFVECHVEKGALIPLLKKKKTVLTDILITRPMTNNEADHVADDVSILMASQEAIRDAWRRNQVATTVITTREGPVKVVVNPYYLPDDTDFAQAMHCECPKVVGSPERKLLIFKRQIVADGNGYTANYFSDSCPYELPALPIPIRLYEDIGFGPVDLTSDGLRPIDPKKTEEDIELFICKEMEKSDQEIEIVFEKDG
ncbi:MAG: hypothetical protein LLG04_10930 [Parachlamydia sp.]|nr:hypothetical protein [Parachlamydia sp.]